MPVEESSVAYSVELEVMELHQFFEDWFQGRTPDTDAAFARLPVALAPEFEMRVPSGHLRKRETLLSQLRAMHGQWAGDPSKRIEVRNIRIRANDGDLVMASYEEWQRVGETEEGRASTVVLRRDARAPNGLSWVWVHESWLPTSTP
jgi:hypothetical protein